MRFRCNPALNDARDLCFNCFPLVLQPFPLIEESRQRPNICSILLKIVFPLKNYITANREDQFLIMRPANPHKSLQFWKIKSQLDVTCYFIVLLIGSTCFGHYYAHHQELATMMLITTLVVSFLMAVCWRLGPVRLKWRPGCRLNLEPAVRTTLQPNRT